MDTSNNSRSPQRGKVRFVSELLSRVRRYVDVSPLLRAERVSLEWAAERLALHGCSQGAREGAPCIVDLSADRLALRSTRALLRTYEQARVDRLLPRALVDDAHAVGEEPRVRLVAGDAAQPTLALRFAGGSEERAGYDGALLAHRASLLSDLQSPGLSPSPRDAFLREVRALLRPRGRVVLLEASPSREAREAARLLHAFRFPRVWTEPREDLEARLVRAGFVHVRSASLPMSTALTTVIAEAPG